MKQMAEGGGKNVLREKAKRILAQRKQLSESEIHIFH